MLIASNHVVRGRGTPGRTSASSIAQNGAAVVFLAFIVVALSVFISARGENFNHDTANYVSYYRTVVSCQCIPDGRFELGFGLITYLVAATGASAKVYLWALAMLLNVVLLRVCSHLIRFARLERYWFLFVVLVIGWMLVSRWYVVATVNGLRQGLADMFLYLALAAFLNRHRKEALVAFVAALLIHRSVLMVVPFIPLMFLGRRAVTIVVLALAVAYPVGGGKLLTELVSSALGIGVYDMIMSYGAESRWIGLHWGLYLYSVFIGVAVLAAARFVKDEYQRGYKELVQAYLILLAPYFVFGFGGYANRYAFIAWFFSSFVVAYATVAAKLGSRPRIGIAFILSAIALINYVGRITGGV